MTKDPEFKGHLSDVGGPTANMYKMRCSRPDVEAKCRRLSCIHPTVCKLLGVDHGPTKQLLKHVYDQACICQVQDRPPPRPEHLGPSDEPGQPPA